MLHGKNSDAFLKLQKTAVNRSSPLGEYAEGTVFLEHIGRELEGFAQEGFRINGYHVAESREEGRQPSPEIFLVALEVKILEYREGDRYAHHKSIHIAAMIRGNDERKGGKVFDAPGFKPEKHFKKNFKQLETDSSECPFPSPDITLSSSFLLQGSLQQKYLPKGVSQHLRPQET